MRIGFCFYGIIYGPGGRTGSDRDFRHCWPNIKRMLIDPFVAKGHESVVYFSGYPIEDEQINEQFYSLINPHKVFYSDFIGSNPFTAKSKAVNEMANETDLDVIVICRSDIHFSKMIANDNVDLTKFNFLFKESGDWWESERFTTDNIYIYPHSIASEVSKALAATYRFPRSAYVDTHGLYNKLILYIPIDMINFISEIHEYSDVNSYYTLCRNELPAGGRGGLIHPEVKERFGYE